MRTAASIIVIVPFFVVPALLALLGMRVARLMPAQYNLVLAAFIVWLFAEGVHRATEAMGWNIAAVEYAAAVASIGVIFETVRYVRWLPKIVQEGDAGNGRNR